MYCYLKNKKALSTMAAYIMLLILILINLSEITVSAAAPDLNQMYQRAVDYPQGDLTRLANTLRKAQRGQEITIGFIGGSITEGFNASTNENCYVSLVHKWWCEKFPKTKINLVNAGIGGTSSYLGVHRVETELLVHKPDLVFIEFAVNDSYTEFCMNSYESLIRKIMTSEKTPAVVLLFATNALGDGVQAVEEALGLYYNLPMISYKNAVIPEVEAGNFAWNEISSDIVHPNDLGHGIFASLITRYLDELYIRVHEIPSKTEWTLPEPITLDRYTDAYILDCSTLEPVAIDGFGFDNVNYHFKNNWRAITDKASISFLVNASDIGVIYQRTVDGTSGMYDVYIDGVLSKTLDGNFVQGYGTETDVEALYSSELNEKNWHIITIMKNPKSKNIKFTIVGFLVS